MKKFKKKIVNQHNAGWLPVERDVKINFDLETTPLEIKTDSVAGSSDKIFVNFFDQQDEYAGGVKIFFSSMQYSLVDCLYPSQGYDFSTSPTTDDNKVWRITLVKTSDTRRVVIHCNEVEVLIVMLSADFCEGSGSDWSTNWMRDVTRIKFTIYDGASNFYQIHKPGRTSSYSR